MPFNLRLYVTGLCAVVPNGASSVIVLPNARDVDHMGNPISPTNLGERHIPMLCVLSKGWTSQRPDSFLIPAASDLAPYDMTAFPLNQEDIVISPVNAGAGVPKAARPSGCPSNATASDFGWIANLNDVNATPLASLTAAAFPVGVALARLHVADGSWSTDNMAAGPLQPNGHPYVLSWSYQDMMGGKPMPGRPPGRPLADVVMVEIPIDHASQVTFQSSVPNGNGDVIFDGGGKDVVAYIVNIPLTVLLATQPGVRPPETHFAHFYRLANKLPTMWIPAPSGDCSPVGPGTQTVPHCPPARF